MTDPQPQDILRKKIAEEIERFYMLYEQGCVPYIQSCSQGKITVEEQVKKTTQLWNNLMKQTTQQIAKLFATHTKALVEQLEKEAIFLNNGELDSAYKTYEAVPLDRAITIVKEGKK